MTHTTRSPAPIIALTLLTGLAATELLAAQHSFAFTAVVTSVNSPLNSQFAIGQTISGTYTFDGAASDSLSGDSSVGFYENAFVTATAVVSNGYTVNYNPLGISDLILVDNSNSPDIYDVFIPVSGASVSGASPDLLEFALQDNNGTMLSSDNLPLSPPSYASAELHDGSLRFRIGTNTHFVNFNLLSLTAVPEPASLALAITAYLGAVFVRRRPICGREI